MKTKNEKQNEVFNTGKWRNTMKRRKKKPGSTLFRGAELFRLAFPEFATVLAARAQEGRPMGIQPTSGEAEKSRDQLESKASIPPPAPTGKEFGR